ncbi:MAG: lytic transglycosylase domain-containing protein [Proteobacteria bacterium]|nr:lytic transglycosylase domain-containing protein [Pseudomonadota bacterium]
MKKFILTIFLFVIASASASALTPQQLSFKKTYKQALQGNEDRVKIFKDNNKTYRLNHYLDFALLKAKIPTLPIADIQRFQQLHKGSPLNKQLDSMLTYDLGKQKKWAKYLQRYNNNRGSAILHCWYLQARIDTKDLKGLPQAITDTWMNGLSLSAACNSVFKWWASEGYRTDELISQRIKLAFQVNNTSTAKYLAAKMKQQPSWVKRAILLMQDPIITLKQTVNWQDNSINRELVYLQSQAMASKHPNTMYSLWRDLKKHFKFTAKQKATVDRTIALFAATDYLPFTIKAMDDLPPAQHDAQINAWKVRYHLYHSNWEKVVAIIDIMPDFQRNKDSWQYWLARASAKNNQPKQAKNIFTKLAKKSNYYGFLAADHVRMPYVLCNQDIASEKIINMPENVTNAFELFALDMITEARQEWIIGYRQLNIGQRRALADIAYQKGWYNKVSAIMGALGLWQNYKMRYPLAYKTEITKLAKQYNLLPQWIMSIITQESAWQTDAVSRADARGLMQIIDPTAKRLSKQLGLSYEHKSQLHNSDFNLQLGIYYQRQLFDKFDNHPILALASYNAGESKAIDWLRGFPVAPDIWAETIPYRETRGYITKILTNITIYDWLINQTPRRISSWMPTFPVDGAIMKQWPNAQTAQQTAKVVCN